MTTVDLAKVPEYAQRFRTFMDQFKSMYVDRDRLIDFITLALLTREHLLMFGSPGTAKTQIIDSVLDGIRGARNFRTEVSGYTAEDGVLGPYNVKRLREEGVLEHNTSGMLPEAQFARVGEFLDANAVTLRALLGIMNERRLLRGSQTIESPLMTAYLDTNKDPALYLKKNPDAWAVIDRVLLIEKVGYLNTPANVQEMVTRFQRGASRRPRIFIDVEVIQALSSLIVNPPGLITDTSIIETYATIVTEYREKRQQLSDDLKKEFILPEISDRRVNKASMVMEANAVLNGRLFVTADDIPQAGLVLCTSKPERDVWDAIVKPHVEEHKKRSAAQVSNAQGLALKAIGDRVESEILRADPHATSAMLAQTLKVLSEQFASITPTTDEVHHIHEGVQQKLKAALTEVKARTMKETGLDTLSF